MNKKFKVGQTVYWEGNYGKIVSYDRETLEYEVKSLRDKDRTEFWLLEDDLTETPVKQKYPKQHYIGMEYSGYRWGCFENGYHIFSKQFGPGGKHFVVYCTDEDLENGNIVFFIKNGYSR